MVSRVTLGAMAGGDTGKTPMVILGAIMPTVRRPSTSP